MPSTMNPDCLLCGLRFGNKPLLDLHIREDHRPSPARKTVTLIPAAPAPARPGLTVHLTGTT